MYTVILDNIQVWAPIGLFQQESVLKNKLTVSVALRDPEAALSSLPYYDYGIIHQLVLDVCAIPTALLEDLLTKIVSAIKQRWPNLLVNVKITKHRPPLMKSTANAHVQWEEFNA